MGSLNGFRKYNRQTAVMRPIKKRILDYKELYEKIPEDKIKEQAARCMDCGTPFCNWGCPLGNLMPDWNDMVYKGEWEKAFKELCLTSTFPEITGRICPALCEGSCTLGVNRDAVSIKEIEKYIIEKAFEEGWLKPNPPKVRTGKKIAIIGSGPSGLSAAAALNSVGHSVKVFEKNDAIGGLLRYGIPDFKLDKSIIDRRLDIMRQEGIEFKTNIEVSGEYAKDKITNEYDAVILTCGSSVPRDLKVEGRELKGVYFAMDYLTQQNKLNAGKSIGKDEIINARDKTVCVIGGGDTGSDCIGTAIRQGAKKVIQYEIMPKPPIDRNETMPWPLYPRTLKTTSSHEEGCERQWSVLTKKLKGENGILKSLCGIKLNWEKDNKGSMVMNEIKGTEFEENIDLLIIAMGFLHPQIKGIVSDLELFIDAKDNVRTDENYMTSKAGIFAAGDMRRGQSLVVWAIDEGKKAAKSVDRYLMGETSL